MLRRHCTRPFHPASAAAPFLAAALLIVAVAGPAYAQGSSTEGIGGVMIGAHLVHPKPAPPPPGIGPMYQAYAVVTGTDMRQRPWGFAKCLGEVLVKVSGDPALKDDPRTAKLSAHADRFVAAFNYTDLMAGDPLHDDQGTFDRPYRLMVYFDPKRVDSALAQLGERPWLGARPVIMPLLLVEGPKPPAYVLSADIPAGAEQRGSFDHAASELGMKVRFPGPAELAAWDVSATHFPSPTSQPPASRAGNEMVVLGTLQWSETLPGWIGSWRTRWHGTLYSWGVQGVSYDAAFGDIVSGAVWLASGRGPPK